MHNMHALVLFSIKPLLGGKTDRGTGNIAHKDLHIGHTTKSGRLQPLLLYIALSLYLNVLRLTVKSYDAPTFISKLISADVFWP